MKLVQKLGKKADLKVHGEILSDPSSNCPRISKEKVVKSIRDEVYTKKTNDNNRNKNVGSGWMDTENAHVITDVKANQSVEVPNGSQTLRDFFDLNDEESKPLVIFDLKGKYFLLSKLYANLILKNGQNILVYQKNNFQNNTA